LVLLAVVLIVALVSVALLGFFPGMASDSQIAQSKAYWQSQPLAVNEITARHSTGWAGSVFAMKIQNNGAYPIKITKIMGGSNCWWGNKTIGSSNMTGYDLGPGEGAVIGDGRFGGSYRYSIPAIVSDSPGTSNCNGGGVWYAYLAKSMCQNSNSTPGFLQINNFGFEYVQYVDGQAITKRQVGTELLLVKCIEPVA